MSISDTLQIIIWEVKSLSQPPEPTHVKLSNWSNIYALIAGVAIAFTGIDVLLDFVAFRLEKYVLVKKLTKGMLDKIAEKVEEVKQWLAVNEKFYEDEEKNRAYVESQNQLNTLKTISQNLSIESQKKIFKSSISGLFCYLALSCFYFLFVASLQDDYCLRGTYPYRYLGNFMVFSSFPIVILSSSVVRVDSTLRPILTSVVTFLIVAVLASIFQSKGFNSTIEEFFCKYHGRCSQQQRLKWVHASTVFLSISYCFVFLGALLYQMFYGMRRCVDKHLKLFDDTYNDLRQNTVGLKQPEKLFNDSFPNSPH